MYTLSNGTETREVSNAGDMLATAEQLQAGNPSIRVIIRETFADGTARWLVAPEGHEPSPQAPVSSASNDTIVPQAPATIPAPASAPRINSDFGGALVVDDAAKSRIEGLHATLARNGVEVDTSQQFFATGTRMADIGYDTQRQRKAEHDAKTSVRDAAHALATAVRDEKREDRVITAGDLGKAIQSNGKVSAFGLRLTEQAIRGLCTRLESPALGYLLGVRNRVAETRSMRDVAKRDGLLAVAAKHDAALHADNAKIADVLAHELFRAADTKLKLRTRQNPGDVYAIVSPGYVPADAPAVLGEILAELPRDAKASWAYDPVSTRWELRAEVFTTTPVDEQAVGEPFEAFVSFQSKDNGTSSFRGGGGIVLIRCLNASTYLADGVSTNRRHMGRIMHDIRAMTEKSAEAMHALCAAWGENRAATVEVPSGVSINDAIPGFWRYLLRDTRSELAGVLPGRTDGHVKGLTQAFHDERRVKGSLVKSDFAQGWTRYIQDTPTDVRRNAESAVGEWLVRNGRIACDLENA